MPPRRSLALGDHGRRGRRALVSSIICGNCRTLLGGDGRLVVEIPETVAGNWPNFRALARPCCETLQIQVCATTATPRARPTSPNTTMLPDDPQARSLDAAERASRRRSPAAGDNSFSRCRDVGCAVIATGIDNEADLEVVPRPGLHAGPGRSPRSAPTASAHPAPTGLAALARDSNETPNQSPPMSATPKIGEPIPGYVVKERIGVGGYGEVWSVQGTGGLDQGDQVRLRLLRRRAGRARAEGPEPHQGSPPSVPALAGTDRGRRRPVGDRHRAGRHEPEGSLRAVQHATAPGHSARRAAGLHCATPPTRSTT